MCENNTNVKIFMKIEDSKECFKMFKKATKKDRLISKIIIKLKKMSLLLSLRDYKRK